MVFFDISLDDSSTLFVVRIETENGIVGWGENSPFLTINGESVDTGIVVGKLFIPFLIGKNALNIEDCVNLMDNIIYGNNSIKSAFDIALHDIAAQHNKLPLYMYLGGSIQKEIQTDYTVSLNTPELMAQQAIEIRDNGFEVIKVKLGKNGKEDVKRIKAIRAAIGNDIPLRIDANQGWQVHEAIETLYALGKYNIQHAEEPIARWNYMHLPSIKLVSPIPIMCDESCYDINDLERLILLKACSKINIKLLPIGYRIIIDPNYYLPPINSILKLHIKYTNDLGIEIIHEQNIFFLKKEI